MIIQHKGRQRDRGWTTDFQSFPRAFSYIATREGEYIALDVIDVAGRTCRILYTEEEAHNLYRAAVGLSYLELEEQTSQALSDTDPD